MEIKQHLPSLQADIVGELDEDGGLAYFRGIPYASVEKRWTHSRTRHSLESPFDATKFGPRCTQQVGQVLVSGGVNDPIPGDDEFKCLNLNITIPIENLKHQENGHEKSLLPVMVWIHGGGFNYGANSVARYRPKVLCSLAKKSNHPMVLVQIGYRLGIFGCAASQDLESELQAASTVNGRNGHTTRASSGTYGMVDQRNAFEWVQDHIRDFGGDPENVTAFGISAGSASVHYHILTGTPLFDRAICMSGSAPTLGPLPFEMYEDAWRQLSKRTAPENDSPAERLEKLRAIKAEEIINNYTTAAMGPMGDDNLLPASWQFGDHRPTRCKELILGDTRVEGIILDGVIGRTPQARFNELIRSAFPSSVDADAFSKAFGFTAEERPFEAYRDSMRRFFSIMMFQYPNLRIADAYAAVGKAYLYHFEEPSQYPGPTYGLSYHGQCALYMYNNESSTYSAGGRQTAEDMALRWTAFAHGKAPWKSYADSKAFMRFGPDGQISMKDLKSDDIRDYGYVDWLRDHFEPVKELAQRLLKSQ